MSAELMFGWTFPVAAPFWALMILAPGWSVTRRVIGSPLIVLPAALIYALLVLPELGTFLPAVADPSLAGVATLLGTPRRRGRRLGPLHRLRPVRRALDVPGCPRAWGAPAG